MGFEFKNEFEEKYNTIDELCDRALSELDEEHPWITIVRRCIEKIKEINNNG